ncbi:MAG: CBS domain-containing protein [Kofleriaceae bacterium]
MRPGAFTIDSRDTLAMAQRAMTKAKIRHLPVVQEGKLVGMLSQRDLIAYRARVADDSWWSTPVYRAMTSPAQYAHPDDSLTEIAARLAQDKLGALPILDHGKIVGIATISDVLDAEVRVAMAPPLPATATAADAMVPLPYTIAPDALLVDAVEMMQQRHVRHLPVVDARGDLIGMLSERDIRTLIGDPVHYTTSLGLSLGQPRVREAMTPHAIAVPFDLPLSQIVHRFTDDKIGALPVLDKFGAVIGIISYIDALRVLARAAA